MSNINIMTQETVRPDRCPVDLRSRDCQGKSTPNKLQKPLRQHPSRLDPLTSPKCPKPHPREPVGKPLSASLKAKIREGPVGKSLGRLAVEHKLVPYPYENALMGIPEDGRHSRWSYMMIANEAIDHARLHLEKGERPKFVFPAETQTAPAAFCVPVTSQVNEDERAGVEHINLSAPAELEASEGRRRHLSAVELPATVRRPSYLRLGKKHPLCDKFEESMTIKDSDELHFNKPEAPKPTNFSKPLPSVLQIRTKRSGKSGVYHELDSNSDHSQISRHPIALRAGARRSNTAHHGAEATTLSHPGYALTGSKDCVDLTNHTAPPAVSLETDSVRNIKMLIGRTPSVRDNGTASPKSEAKRRSRQHRGTVIVTCDSDKANRITDDSFVQGLAALRELGQTQDSQDSGYASDSSTSTSGETGPGFGYSVPDSPVVATAAVAVQGRAAIVNSPVQPQPHPHPHPHPLRSNPTTAPAPRSLRSVRRVTRDPANQGVAFGVQQFREFDPAAVYRASDDYRSRREARRRQAKMISEDDEEDLV